MPNLTEFRFRVEAYVQATKAEVEYMIKCSERHYDTRCKQASKEGGFLYGWRNRFDWGNTTEEKIRVTWNEMDTLCKILEVEYYMRDEDNLHLLFKCSQILAQMSAESERVNSTET